MSERGRDRDRYREDKERDHRDRHRDDRDRYRRRDKDDRDRDLDRRDRDRDRRSRSRSVDHHNRRNHHRRTPSPENHHHRRKRDRDDHDYDERKAVSDFVDGIAKEHDQKKRKKNSPENDVTEGGDAAVEGGEDVDDEMEMMRKLGIPVGFDSTKGKPVPGADVSGVRAVTKRQPRQYMNRRGGFNRPLPPERNR